MRALGLLDVTCLGVNAVIGSSIFLFPGQLAEQLGPASPAAFGLTALLLAPVGLCFAKAAAGHDQAGGTYLYARDLFGPAAGFGIGWLCWVSQVFSWAAVANAVAVYLGYFDPLWASPAAVKSVAVGAILSLGALNYRGVKQGAWASNFFTAAKLLPLGVFIAAGLPSLPRASFAAPADWSGLGKACFLTYFAFQGFENAPVPAGEVRDARRNVPRAILLALGLAAGVYMLVQLVAVAAHPGLASSRQPLAEAAERLMGPWGAALIVAGAVFSTVGYNSGTALITPRYLASLAQAGELPAALAAEHPRFKTPAASVAVTALVAALAAAALDFNKLVDFSNVVICAQYLATCAAVMAANRRSAGPALWTALPLAGMASTLWLGSQGGWAQVAYAGAALALGFGLRAAFQRTPRKAPVLAFALAALAAPASAVDLDRISAERIAENLAELSRRPHVAGTPENRRQAERLAARYREHGLEVTTSEYEVLLSYPKEASLELVSPVAASLAAPEGEHLPDRGSYAKEDLMPWNAYAPSGDVTAPVVYANFARPEDFEFLKSLGLDVKGKLVLARYGEGYRGGKTLEAERRGAAGIIFYSDPAQDGYAKGPAIPRGPWGSADHFQRGSNVYDFIVPGDPLTPGWPSKKGARRIKAGQSAVLPKIPSLPISHRDALRILQALAGPGVPPAWRGALPVSYHAGPGPAVARLKIENTLEVRPIVNVIARLRGSREPEKEVFISSHHDAWTRGAVDDGIGGAISLELARVFGALAREGKRPRRSLVFASWDAEEYTLTGSTEWGEEHAERLRRDAVAFLNIDAYRWGKEFTALAVPSLKAALAGSLVRVRDPDTGLPLYKAWSAQAQAKGARPEIGVLGSGSDYTVFLNHLGVPSVETMFTGTAGVYHSIYDGPEWVEQVDPGLKYVRALAQVNADLAWTLADDEVLPFDYEAYAHSILDYLSELKALPGAPAAELALAAAAARRWLKASGAFADKTDGTLPEGSPVNRHLMSAERALLDPAGLPGRPWFKHLIYAPLPTYEAETLPGIREALAEGDAARAAAQARALEAALNRAALALRKAAAAD